MLDKEVPYNQIPPQHMELYLAAEVKEWRDWLKNECIEIVYPEDAAKVRNEINPNRIIRLRFVYRDKNASVRTPQMPLPVKAKARLCAQASKEPLAMQGLLKLDSPTVQRVGIMIFLQVTVNLRWTQHWRKGDVSSAFLQGQDREPQARLVAIPRPRPRLFKIKNWESL